MFSGSPRSETFEPGALRQVTGHVRDRQSEARAQEQQLDVEREAIDDHLLEERLDALAVHQLEAALRVAKGKPRHRADDRVEGPPHRLAQPPLPHLHVGVRKRAGADDDVEIAIADHRGELRVLLDRRREIGVGHEHEASPRLEHAVADRVALAAVLAVSDHAAAPAGERLCGQLRGLVLRAVVDHEDLRVDAGGVEVRRDLPRATRRVAPPRCMRGRRSTETGG